MTHSDGLFVTEMGYISLTYGIIIVDVSRRSTSFEHRIQKYLNRGFVVIFPGAAVNSRGQYNFFNLCVNTEEGSCVVAKGCEISDYFDSRHYDDNYLPSYLPLKDLSIDRFDRLACSGRLETVLHPESTDAGFKKLSLNIPYYLQAADPVKYLGRFAVSYTSCLTKGDFVGAQKCISFAKTDLLETLEKVRVMFDKGIEWNTVDPTTQKKPFTGSFNPIFEHPYQWYLSEYQTFKIGLPDKIYSTLRLLGSRQPQWRQLSSDLFRRLCQYVMVARAQHIISLTMTNVLKEFEKERKHDTLLSPRSRIEDIKTYGKLAKLLPNVIN